MRRRDPVDGRWFRAYVFLVAVYCVLVLAGFVGLVLR